MKRSEATIKIACTGPDTSISVDLHVEPLTFKFPIEDERAHLIAEIMVMRCRDLLRLSPNQLLASKLIEVKKL